MLCPYWLERESVGMRSLDGAERGALYCGLIILFIQKIATGRSLPQIWIVE